MREGAQASEERAAPSSPHHAHKPPPGCVHCFLPLASRPSPHPLTNEDTLLNSTQAGSISINLGTVRAGDMCGAAA